jgi:hypothetical protein
VKEHVKYSMWACLDFGKIPRNRDRILNLGDNGIDLPMGFRGVSYGFI